MRGSPSPYTGVNPCKEAVRGGSSAKSGRGGHASEEGAFVHSAFSPVSASGLRLVAALRRPAAYRVASGRCPRNCRGRKKASDIMASTATDTKNPHTGLERYALSRSIIFSLLISRKCTKKNRTSPKSLVCRVCVRDDTPTPWSHRNGEGWRAHSYIFCGGAYCMPLTLTEGVDFGNEACRTFAAEFYEFCGAVGKSCCGRSVSSVPGR